MKYRVSFYYGVSSIDRALDSGEPDKVIDVESEEVLSVSEAAELAARQIGTLPKAKVFHVDLPDEPEKPVT